MTTIDLPVHAIAHARAGDKGDISNISLIAYLDSGWDIINHLATEDAIQSIFKHLGSTRVDRYELPNLKALNFVIQSALGGGVNSSLRLDRPLNSPYLKKFIEEK
jgi:hypothetical protein